MLENPSAHRVATIQYLSNCPNYPGLFQLARVTDNCPCNQQHNRHRYKWDFSLIHLYTHRKYDDYILEWIMIQSKSSESLSFCVPSYLGHEHIFCDFSRFHWPPQIPDFPKLSRWLAILWTVRNATDFSSVTTRKNYYSGTWLLPCSIDGRHYRQHRRSRGVN